MNSTNENAWDGMARSCRRGHSYSTKLLFTLNILFYLQLKCFLHHILVTVTIRVSVYNDVTSTQDPIN